MTVSASHPVTSLSGNRDGPICPLGPESVYQARKRPPASRSPPMMATTSSSSSRESFIRARQRTGFRAAYDPPVRFRRLLPDPAEGEGDAQLSGLELAARAPAGLPWVVANFVMAADGRAAFRGESAPLGSDGDREVFHRLRTQ